MPHRPRQGLVMRISAGATGTCTCERINLKNKKSLKCCFEVYIMDAEAERMTEYPVYLGNPVSSEGLTLAFYLSRFKSCWGHKYFHL